VKTENILISIVTVTSGDEQHLRAIDESFRLVDGVEWIVISGGNSFFFSKKNPIHHMSLNSNLGIYPSMNEGLNLSRGKYVLFMNGGDTFSSQLDLKLILKVLSKNSASIFFGNAIYKSPSLKKWKNPDVNSRRFYFGTNSFCHQATIASREELINLGGFYESAVGSDWAVSLALAAKSYRLLKNEIAIYELGGYSSKQKFLKEVREKIELRRYYGVNRHSKITENVIEFLILFASRTFKFSKSLVAK
jgi:glycosyltransferase involved in cell wall biosynthesis